MMEKRYQMISLFPTLLFFSFLPRCQKGSSSSRQSTQQASSPQKASVIQTAAPTSSTQVESTAVIDTATEILPQQPPIITATLIGGNTTPLTVQSVTPETETISVIPKSLTLTTSTDIQAPSEKSIFVTGTCAIRPIIWAVNRTGSARIWDLFLAGMNCQEGQTIVLTIDPTELTTLSNAESGTGDPVIRTYTVRTKGPTLTWGTVPTTTYLASTTSLSIPFTYTNATQLAPSTPQSPNGVSLTGTTTCQAALQDFASTGGTVVISGCIGTGTIEVQVKGGLVTDDLGNPSSASSVVEITVDTTPPSVLTMLPVDAPVNPIPKNVLISLNKPIKTPLSPTLLSTNGCNSLITGVSVSQDAQTLTATLSSSTCTDGAIVTVTVAPSQLVDLNGNVGTALPQSTQYTLHTAKPTTTLTPTPTTVLGSTSALSIPVTFSSTLPLTAAAVLPTSLYVTSTGAATCTPSLGPVVSQGTTATAVLSLSGCQGNGPFAIGLAGGILQDSLKNLSAPSNLLPPFAIDTTPPTATLTPISTTRVSPIYPSVTATSNKKIQTPLSSSLFAASSSTSTCTPTLGAASLSSTGTVATASLSTSGCVTGDRVTVTLDPNQLIDTLGNKSIGVAKIQSTYTLDTRGPSVSLSTPSLSILNATNTATITATYTSTGTISAASTPPAPLYSMLPTGNALCKLTPGTTTGLGTSTVTSTFSLSACTGQGSLSLTVNPGSMKDEFGNPSSIYSTSQSYLTVDALNPSLVSITPSNSSTYAFTPSSLPITATFNTTPHTSVYQPPRVQRHQC